MFGVRYLDLTPAEFYGLTPSDYWWLKYAKMPDLFAKGEGGGLDELYDLMFQDLG